MIKKLEIFCFKRIYVRASIIFVSAAMLLLGCASAQTSFSWINPNLMTDDWSTTREMRDEWAKKINDLPIELHGALPNQSSARTAAMIHNVESDDITTPVEVRDILLTKQRIVLYLDEVDIPVRKDFCALRKKLRIPPVADKKLTLRGAVCDGAKIVCYAAESENSSVYPLDNIDVQVTHLKKVLIAALYPGLTLNQAHAAGW